MERTFLARAWSDADHHWVLANPLCSVTGAITLTGPSGPVRLSLNGQGYHDHNYGTGPIGPGLRRWMWGRVLAGDGDHALMFHLAQPRDAAHPDELHLVEADAFGLRELTGETASLDWRRTTATGLRYPANVRAGPLVLRDPTVIDASPFYLRLSYAATVRGLPGRAFCEVAYPHRLRWPVLVRMIEMSSQQGVERVGRETRDGRRELKAKKWPKGDSRFRPRACRGLFGGRPFQLERTRGNWRQQARSSKTGNSNQAPNSKPKPRWASRLSAATRSGGATRPEGRDPCRMPRRGGRHASLPDVRLWFGALGFELDSKF